MFKRKRERNYPRLETSVIYPNLLTLILSAPDVTCKWKLVPSWRIQKPEDDQHWNRQEPAHIPTPIFLACTMLDTSVIHPISSPFYTHTLFLVPGHLSFWYSEDAGTPHRTWWPCRILDDFHLERTDIVLFSKVK